MRIRGSLPEFSEDDLYLIKIQISHFPFLNADGAYLSKRVLIADFAGSVELIEHCIQVTQFVVAGFGEIPFSMRKAR